MRLLKLQNTRTCKSNCFEKFEKIPMKISMVVYFLITLHYGWFLGNILKMITEPLLAVIQIKVLYIFGWMFHRISYALLHVLCILGD